MKKTTTKKSQEKYYIDGLDFSALISALFYTNSVNTNLNHYFYWRFVEHPTIPFLVISLGLVAYVTTKHKKLSTMSVITLTIIATASFIWLSGFRVNVFPMR